MTHLITINGVMALGTTIPFLLKLAPYGATTIHTSGHRTRPDPVDKNGQFNGLTERRCYGQIFDLLLELLSSPFSKRSNSKATLGVKSDLSNHTESARISPMP